MKLAIISILATIVSASNHMRKRNLPAQEMAEMATHKLKITNLAYQQPFSPFFVMVHSKDVDPIYEFGKAASEALATLAEDGMPGDLVNMYSVMTGVCKVKAFAEEAPYTAGETATIPVAIDDDGGCDRVTIATMAINTNDCFIAMNGVKIMDGDTFFLPGLDAGSEANDEKCANIPGPACPAANSEEDTGSGMSSDMMSRAEEDGEGVVHVHRGIHGIADLSSDGYDWRNPMAYVIVESA